MLTSLKASLVTRYSHIGGGILGLILVISSCVGKNSSSTSCGVIIISDSFFTNISWLKVIWPFWIRKMSESTNSLSGKSPFAHFSELCFIQNGIFGIASSTNNKGETMHYSWRVSYVKPWENGQLREMKVNEDDLPF